MSTMSSPTSSQLSRSTSPQSSYPPQLPPRSPRPSPKGPREGRSLIACSRCRRLKKKCKPEEGRARCERCRITDQTCSYVPVSDESHETKRRSSPSQSAKHASPEPSPEPAMIVDSSIQHSHSSHADAMGCRSPAFAMEHDGYSGAIRPHGRLSYEQNEMLFNSDSLARTGGGVAPNIYFAPNITTGAMGGFCETSQMTHQPRQSLYTFDCA